MIYMLDTANLEAIERAVDLYPLAGVTTNPSIVAKENRPLRAILGDIRQLIGKQRMLHAQVMSNDAQTMLLEAQALRAVDEQIIVKVPVSTQGIKAMKLISEHNIPITATAILSPQQALLAAMAGAQYLAPYVNRLDNIGGDGVALAAQMVKLMSIYNLQAKVLAASFKNVQQVHMVALAGVQSVTIAPDVFEQLLVHPLTEQGIEGFNRDWHKAYGQGATLLDVL